METSSQQKVVIHFSLKFARAKDQNHSLREKSKNKLNEINKSEENEVNSYS